MGATRRCEILNCARIPLTFVATPPHPQIRLREVSKGMKC